MAKKKAALADPTRLEPFDSTDKQMLRVVIETPKGSRNKFAFNARRSHFRTEEGACRREWHFLTTSDLFPPRKLTTVIPSTFWC